MGTLTPSFSVLLREIDKKMETIVVCRDKGLGWVQDLGWLGSFSVLVRSTPLPPYRNES